MKFYLATLLLALSNALVTDATKSKLCLGQCTTDGDEKTCTFHVGVDLFASELGYYTMEECDGPNPTLGIEYGVTYKFIQQDETNYYHPLGFAYYPDGAHDDVDELEPGIVPPGSMSDCTEGGQLTCPAPMYIRDGVYLGVYSNNEAIKSPMTSSDDFGLDVYEPEFFLDPLTWNSAGTYEVALKFDVDDFSDDIFYFCHIHQFMTGRIKFINSQGDLFNKKDKPKIPYKYDKPSKYDRKCGTFGLDEFQLPHPECPEKFVCGKLDTKTSVGRFADCLDSMNCAMTVGMTTNINMGSAIALFNHQMIPHHQNAVNMCKALMTSGEIQCPDLTAEEDEHCIMARLCYEIINGQNFQIQTMRGVLESLNYDEEDDCRVPIKSWKKRGKSSKSKKKSKKEKKKGKNNWK